MAAGVKPQSREAVRLVAQGFTRDDSPGDYGWLRSVGFAIWLQKAHDPQVKQGTRAKPPETSTLNRHQGRRPLISINGAPHACLE
jgi:hypothetical protein